jgi:hypothetical protein
MRTGKLRTGALARVAMAVLAFAVPAAAQTADPRERVASAAAAPVLSSVIDPDQGIFGIPFGTGEDQFIARYGRPDGYLRLSETESAMLYGRSHLFLFADGKLNGVRIARHSVLDWKISELMQDNSRFGRLRWKLNNGIALETSLAEIRKILGPALVRERYQNYYTTRHARVDLDFSHYTNEGEKDEAYKLHGILIRPK